LAAFTRRHYRTITCTLCLLAAAAAAALAGGPVAADGSLLDLLVAGRAAGFAARDAPADSPVAVVALDQRSLLGPELAAYPRALLGPVLAEVLDGVAAAGARVVGFDMIFAYSANRFSRDFDRPFVESLARHRERVVLARSAGSLPAEPFWAALQPGQDVLGLAEVLPDPDGRYRRVRASMETKEDGRLPTLASALLGRARAAPMPDEVLLAPRRHLEAIPTYALIDVLRCVRTSPPALTRAFAGKIVLIGGTLPEEDRKVSTGRFLAPPRKGSPSLDSCGLRRLPASAPDSDTVPGVFLHAAAVAAVMTGDLTHTAPPAVVVPLTAVLAAGGAALGLVLTPWSAAAAILGITGVLLGAGAASLARDIWTPLALPLTMLVGTPVLAYVVRYLVEERARRHIERAFGHYVAPAIVARLAADPSALRLGGERREMTVMFADISGFTAFSSLVPPEVLMEMANRYLGYVVEAVEATAGYVDKFIGDAVMALWGAPTDESRHAVCAVRAALAAVARIRQAGEAAEARGEVALGIKIGINSGLAVVGNVGTPRRYNYTAVGETVNVASRLEGVCAVYGGAIVTGPRTAELASDEILFRELDAVQVKGRAGPLQVFEPLLERAGAPPVERERATRYAEALAHYRATRFAEAHALWQALAREETPSGRSTPASVMAARARAFLERPPARSWDGVWRLSEK